MALNQDRVMGQGVEALCGTQVPEPMVANRHMTHFIAQNYVKHLLKSAGMGRG
jgi:hypothetical protein